MASDSQQLDEKLDSLHLAEKSENVSRPSAQEPSAQEPSPLDELAHEGFEVVFLGTGLTECILSGLLGADGKKVFHTDCHDYYGGATASVKLDKLFEMAPPPEGAEQEVARRAALIASTSYNDWSIDLVPKLLMIGGYLTDILRYTQVVRYCNFVLVKGSYVFDPESTKLPLKVPSNGTEALKYSGINIFQKRKLKNFLMMVSQFDENNEATWDSGFHKRTSKMKEVYESYGLGEAAIKFVGHAMALHPSDDYLHKADGQVVDTFNRIKLYAKSMQDGGSPYVYSAYGCGDIAQSFARLSALHGGTFMLATSLKKLVIENNAVVGIKMSMDESLDFSQPQTFTIPCNTVVADPSYFPELHEQSGEFVIRSTLILDPTKLPKDFRTESMQMIVPQVKVDQSTNELAHDIYTVHLTAELGVCPANYSIAIVTTVGTEKTIAKKALGPALDFFRSACILTVDHPPRPIMRVRKDKVPKGLHLTKSYDSSTHFETVTDDVARLYKDITGKSFEASVKDSDRTKWRKLRVFRQKDDYMYAEDD